MEEHEATPIKNRFRHESAHDHPLLWVNTGKVTAPEWSRLGTYEKGLAFLVVMLVVM